METICTHGSKFFLLRVDPILVRLRPPGKQPVSRKLSPLKNMAEKDESESIHLKGRNCSCWRILFFYECVYVGGGGGGGERERGGGRETLPT